MRPETVQNILGRLVGKYPIGRLLLGAEQPRSGAKRAFLPQLDQHYGLTLPQLAVWLGLEGVVAWLTETLGVQPGMRDGANRNELHVAAACGNAHMCRLLLEAGVDGKAVDDFGWSGFHYAAANGHCQVLAVFMEYGIYYSHKTTAPMLVQVTPAYEHVAETYISHIIR